MRASTYLHTDTLEDALSSLELSLIFYNAAQEDNRYWKWFVVSLHSGVQGCFALALEGTDGLLVQKPRVAGQMLAAFAARAVPPPPHMDNFLRLYSKLQSAGNLRSPDALPLPDSPAQAEGLATLDELRDDFLHFNTKSWSIASELIEVAARRSIEVARFLLRDSRSVRIFEEDAKSRATRAIDALAARLRVDS